MKNVKAITNFTKKYLQFDVAIIDWYHLNNIINECLNYYYYFFVGDTSICKVCLINFQISLISLKWISHIKKI